MDNLSTTSAAAVKKPVKGRCHPEWLTKQAFFALSEARYNEIESKVVDSLRKGVKRETICEKLKIHNSIITFFAERHGLIRKGPLKGKSPAEIEVVKERTPSLLERGEALAGDSYFEEPVRDPLTADDECLNGNEQLLAQPTGAAFEAKLVDIETVAPVEKDTVTDRLMLTWLKDQPKLYLSLVGLRERMGCTENGTLEISFTTGEIDAIVEKWIKR